MRSEESLSRRVVVPVIGLLVATAAGIAIVSWSTAAASRADTEPQVVFDATHLPPLLRMPTEPAELSYDVHCAMSELDGAEAGCDVHGTVFARQRGDDVFTQLPLQRAAGGGRLVAAVPESLAAAARGFEYYAVLEAVGITDRLVLPPGGAAAPHASRVVADAVEIELGRHSFRDDVKAAARVASASWGDGAGEAGLERGRNLYPIGASAFDVTPGGDVVVLDQVHRRLLQWRRGSRAPVAVPVSVTGTLADMALAGDGSTFVLETVAPFGQPLEVKRFDDGGRELEAIETADRASQIRIDAPGPVVLGDASHQWMPVLVGGIPAAPEEQVGRGRGGRRFAGGREVVVLRHENEVRVAIATRGTVTRAWRLTSRTPLAEVQLAEPFGRHVVLVVRVYDDADDEFAVLTLGPSGLVDRFALDSADWAESAPLGRFRLVGRSLYRLGSTASGVFVDRYDLEVR